MEQLKDEYDLINSQAIREHCRKIKHKFNTEELAVLIFRNRRLGIEEKITQYKKLIADYSDMEVIERINCEHYDSVKEMIKDEIKRIQKLEKEMKTLNEDMLYTYEICYTTSKNGFEASDNFYKTYDEVSKGISKEIVEDKENEIIMYKIIKRSFINKNRKIIEEYIFDTNKKAKLININDTEEFLNIDNICLNIPTPFKKGDILVIPITNSHSYLETKIFVLEEICNWRENFQKELDKGLHDSSDMVGTGYYFINEDDFWWDWFLGYDNFEYFEGQLEGNKRILKAISGLIKNEISPDLFLETYKYITAQKTIKKAFWQGFTEEGLECAGLSKEDIKKVKGN